MRNLPADLLLSDAQKDRKAHFCKLTSSEKPKEAKATSHPQHDIFRGGEVQGLVHNGLKVCNHRQTLGRLEP